MITIAHKKWKNNWSYHTKRSKITTDGKNLYSSGYLIGFTDPSLGKICILRNKKDGGYVDSATTKYSNATKEVADVTITFNQYKEVVRIAEEREAKKKK